MPTPGRNFLFSLGRGVYYRKSMSSQSDKHNPPDLSVVVPVHNEADNIRPLVDEIVAALKDGPAFEMVFVNDGSADTSSDVMAAVAREIPNFRALQHARQSGQSVAVHTGVSHARGLLIATLDGDGQNDPADIPNLIAAYREQALSDGKVLIAGWRKGRKDTFVKRMSSKIANGVRSRYLGDATPDTGCGLKVFRREDFLAFPAFNHMHRFLPALMIRHGGRVVSVEVNHRPRERGKSNYGTFDRLWVGLKDIRGVAWLRTRPVNPDVSKIGGDSEDA